MGIFGRKKPAEPPKAEWDWRPGDEAECIWDGNWYHQPSGMRCYGPELGDILTVADAPPAPSLAAGWGLIFKAFPGQCFTPEQFRKVIPISSDEQAVFKDCIKKIARKPVDA